MNRERVLDGFAVTFLLAVTIVYIVILADELIRNGGHW